MDRETARRLMAQSRVAILGTVSPDRRPHLVPCCFAVDDDTIYSAIDAKPKTTLALRRLVNIRADAAVSLLVHHYEEQWSELWWVRADGAARILDGAGERRRAVALLAAKYHQYRETPPPGEVIAVGIERLTSWPRSSRR